MRMRAGWQRAVRDHRRWRRLLWDLQGHRCAGCGRHLRWRDTTLDHVRPTAAGGEDTVSNYQVLCGTCNQTKADTWEGGRR